MQRIHFKLFVLLATIFMIPKAYSAPKYAADNNVAIKEMRILLDEMRHEMNNHESEIRTFEEKLANQEVTIESLREQNLKLSKTHQDTTKNVLANLEMKINSLDTNIKGLTSDFCELKSHARESADKVCTFSRKMIEVEKALNIQSSNLGQLQSALHSMMNILEVKSDLLSTVSPGKELRVHLVKPGDSLAKIAKTYQTNVGLIKEANGLTTDRIRIGQSIKIP